MAITVTLCRFNNLGHSVTYIFLSMVYFLNRFSTFCEKKKKSIKYKFEFLANAPSNSIHLTSSFSLASLRVMVLKMMKMFEIINATDYTKYY